MFTRHSRLLPAAALLVVLLVSAPARAAFLVELFDSALDLTSMAQAAVLMQGQPHARGWYDTINFNDGLGATDGFFNATNGYANHTFPSAVSDTFALRATTTVRVAASGLYTFGLDSDDGAVLRIDDIDLITLPTWHSNRTAFTPTWLEAGDHALELVYFQNHGAATLELFAEAGKTGAPMPGNFSLVGAPGGANNLSAVVPLPPSAALLGLAALPLLLRRRG